MTEGGWAESDQGTEGMERKEGTESGQRTTEGNEGMADDGRWNACSLARLDRAQLEKPGTVMESAAIG